MTRDQITARNRKNAQKSTGPTSARGKAVVAGNARRHGATAQPAPEIVAMWLAIILDTPDLPRDAMMPADDRGVRALSLAQAEARLVAADRALRAFEDELVAPCEAVPGPTDIDIAIFEEFEACGMTAENRRRGRRIMAQIVRQKRKDKRERDDNCRVLLTHYLRAARAKRRKALAAWLEMHQGPRREKPEMQKQSQNSIQSCN